MTKVQEQVIELSEKYGRRRENLLPILQGEQREEPEFFMSGWTDKFRMFRQKEWKIVKAEYPAGEEIKLKFNDTPLSLYQNSVSIKVTLESSGKHPGTIPLDVSYQTCSDKICLAPESKTFYIFPQKVENRQ